ncbi:phosphatase PAP2 family protein [Aquirhabdus parva]|uniref:undecaprenyl-diphosphate phosphatase n=1 Tax=Aquirhabdus parva TaxID=2283318 RepID=A0A345P4N5_9GAMM|nr:phosphatase PAP2 family protein [Aquirhabdus parva]AXI02244.1 phosphatase PAP2 family protein [Aquirhabdus parva]
MSRWQSTVLQVQDWDLYWCLRLNSYSTRQAVARTFKLISRLGDGWFWYGLTLVILSIYGMHALPLLGQAWLTSITGLVIYKLLKHKTLRPRPYQVHQAVMLGERPLDHFSFPSGHTLHAVLFTVMLGTDFPVLLPILVPFMLLVALSRVILGLHYPTDVIMGAVIGATLSGLSLCFML